MHRAHKSVFFSFLVQQSFAFRQALTFTELAELLLFNFVGVGRGHGMGQTESHNQPCQAPSLIPWSTDASQYPGDMDLASLKTIVLPPLYNTEMLLRLSLSGSGFGGVSA
jgi:hypothetical protein